MYIRESCPSRVAFLLGASVVLFCGLFAHAAPSSATVSPGLAPGCPSLNTESAEQAPVEHYGFSGQCVQVGDMALAVSHYALAAAFAHYDMLRVPDKTAHPVITREPLAANAKLNQSERSQLHRATLARQSNPVELATMCAAMTSVGPPRYHPTYMTKFGIYEGPSGKGRPVAKIKDEQGQWKNLLVEFIGCPRG